MGLPALGDLADRASRRRRRLLLGLGRAGFPGSDPSAQHKRADEDADHHEAEDERKDCLSSG